MGLMSYSEPGLLESLRPLAAWQMALFAASCAERQVPVYDLFVERFHGGDPGMVRAALDALWQWAIEGDEDAPGIDEQIAACRAQIPASADYPDALTDFAQDALASVVYGLQALETGNPQFAAWAGRLAYQAADASVALRERVDFNQSGAEAAVLGSDQVQAELGRQSEDLRLIQEMTTNAARTALAKLATTMRERSSLAGVDLRSQVGILLT